MSKSFAFAWAVVAIFTIQSTVASGQGKPDKAAKSEAKPAAAGPAPAPPPPPPPAGPPAMPKPGPEHKALQFLVGNATGEGKLEPGAMGPNSPATTSKYKQSCKWILDGLWVACDMSDASKGGMTWMGHMVIGWDFEAKSYKAVGTDNLGSAFELNAKMDGKKFVMESAREATMMGMPVKFRFTYDTTDPKAVKFTDERSMKGGPFQLAETITIKKP